jgi:hypothetical protein
VPASPLLDGCPLSRTGCDTKTSTCCSTGAVEKHPFNSEIQVYPCEWEFHAQRTRACAPVRQQGGDSLLPSNQLLSTCFTASWPPRHHLVADTSCVDTKDKLAAFKAFHWSMPTAARVKPKYSKCKTGTHPYFVRLVSKWSSETQFCVDIPGVRAGVIALKTTKNETQRPTCAADCCE